MSRDGVVEISEGLAIPRGELEVRATRAGGAGGQHVNTSSTRIELLWNVARTTVLDDERKARVTARLATRIDGEGWLRVVSSALAYRSNRRLIPGGGSQSSGVASETNNALTCRRHPSAEQQNRRAFRGEPRADE